MKIVMENLTREKLPGRLRLQFWLTKCLEVLAASGNEGGRGMLSHGTGEEVIEVNFVSSDEIRRLNKRFRRIDKVTDVLSFSFLGRGSFPGDNLVGQIFIEPVTAQKQAAEHSVSLREEIEFLFVHALLHLFGYDHETEADFKQMYDLQARIMPGPKWATFADQIARESFGRGLSSKTRGR